MTKETTPMEIDTVFDDIVADRRRRRALAGMDAGSFHRLERWRHIYVMSVVCLCMTATFAACLSCTSAPDGRDMRSCGGHAATLLTTNLIIAAL